ncbi:MAG: metallophosphoesterase [Flavobacteriaceae bacterium]|nr:metallophosphoesterase [Flavobacteriaceae bacterium]
MNLKFNSIFFSLILLLLFSCKSTSQITEKSIIPEVYTNIHEDEEGKFYIEKNEKKIYETISKPNYTLSNMKGSPKGTAKGIAFDFGISDFSGTLYFGFIPFKDSKHALPVYFKNPSTISKGKTNLNIKQLAGKYDMINWEINKKGTLGYRVVNNKGIILYDGIVSFNVTENGFEVATGIIEGPYVNLLTADGATISLETNFPTAAKITVNNKEYISKSSTHHEIKITELEADTEYQYSITVENNIQNYSFKTAHKPGVRKPFTFAYASDSRNGKGGGERNVYGTNFYIMKKIMALATQENVSFMQFSGDLINGYLSNIDEMNLQYANCKRAIEPFAHYFPVYTSMGNHESLNRVFIDENKDYIAVDRFPFKTESGEVIFANNFVNPTNGPISEDGAIYDPNKKQIDFPPYKENVFYYTYDNVAVVVMNSNYFYAPSTKQIPLTSGGLHAYIMDQQFTWVTETITKLENDSSIDHIFITEHTPFFPNGGHVGDDMWYNGNNIPRTWVAGKALDKGIIERRDQLLDLFVNKSKKVIAILTGDEHNYAKTEIGPNTNIYPEGYKPQKIKLSRTIYQINNGAAGAPYYAQEKTPWSDKATGFTTQNALVLFHVNAKNIKVEVVNPDTLEKFDGYKLR